MKILHTSDLHLRCLDDARWRALGRLLELAEKEGAGLFCISGDLFDRESDADNLRPQIRLLFSGRKFKVLIIPGNHDCDSYGGEYFGSDAVVFNSFETPFEAGELNIWGIPFMPGGREGILKILDFYRKSLPADKTNIILYHGELLDSFFNRKDFGEEGAGRYMPVRLSDFSGLNADYVLAGHFHTNFSIKMVEDCYFVYPGSPVSVTRRESSRRKANIFEAGAAPREIPLDTFFYDKKFIKFGPFDEASPLEKVEQAVREADENSHLILNLSGTFNGARFDTDESEIAGNLKKFENDRCSFEPFEFRDMQRLACDELFMAFEEKLRSRDIPPGAAERIWELAVRAMVEAGQ